MANGPAYGIAIAFDDKRHDRVMPFLRTFSEGIAGQHGRDQHGKDQGSKQGEGDGPSHGLEEATFDTLQREDGQVGGDDDADGIEDRTLNFVSGFSNAL